MMSLPGKLCIGLLEEDNPLRSYFRFKPLLIDVDGRYAPCGDLSFPQEGCLRIVPDKNESYHFKARMREIGLFCVVDLRQYPGESDKIRPNKNYRPDGEEINANIIYSDVVRAPARDMILQILSADAVDRLLPRPGSESVLLREADGVDPRRYGWEVVPGCDGEGRLVAGDAVCPLEEMQLFDMTGFRGETVSFAIRPASGLEKVSDMPDRQSPEEVKPEPPSVPVASASDPDAASRARPTPSPRVRAAEEKRAPKPDEPAATPGASARMSRAEQLMAQQVGLNPRRGRSLQELIDEKWQQSRMNQLGQCVQDIATGAPVDSPVDTAVRAMREAWQSPALRGPLLSAICELDAMDRMLDAQREARKQAAVTEELDNLEAQKLQLMAELETLKTASEETRRKLRQEICREEDQALKRARSQTEVARAEAERMEQQAADARLAAQDAQALLEQLTGEQLERKIRDVALTRRVLERLDALKAREDADGVPPVPERIDMEAMVGRVQRRFEAEGLPMTRAAAANLCVCLAVSPVLMLTGAPGSGKTVTARLLAEALGLGGRAVTLAPGAQWERQLEALRRFPNAPAALLLDDCNLAGGSDPMGRLTACLPAEWRVIAGLQDSHSGEPVSAAVWDRGFAVRLQLPADMPWQPATASPFEPLAPVSIAALRDSLPGDGVPQSLTQRMDALRRAMTAAGIPLSRRALDDAWRYTAAMLALVGDAPHEAILDLAVAQRLLPGALAAAPIEAAVRLRPLLRDFPVSSALLDQPLPVTV